MTYGELVELALTLDEVEEGTSYGEHSIKRGKKFMFWFNPKVAAVAMKLDWETHDEVLSDFPEIFFKTPHYEGYPAVLVRLEPLELDLAKAIVEASWADALKKAIKRPL